MALDLGIDIVDHGDGLDAECIDRLLATDTPLVPSMLFPARFLDSMGGVSLGFTDGLRHDLEAMAAVLPEANRAGVRLVLGDDFGALNFPHGPYADELAYYVDDVGIPAARRADVGHPQRRRGARPGGRARHGRRPASSPTSWWSTATPWPTSTCCATPTPCSPSCSADAPVTDRLDGAGRNPRPAGRARTWRWTSSRSSPPNGVRLADGLDGLRARRLGGAVAVRRLDGPRRGRPPQRPVGGVGPHGAVRGGAGPQSRPAASTGWRGAWPTASTRRRVWPACGTTPASRFTPPGSGPEAPLTDVIVHGADMLAPSGRSVDVDPVALATSLEFLAGGRAKGFVPKGRIDGLAFEATDLDARVGTGRTVVRGPALALCSAMCGRAAVLDRLSGDGVPVLAARI